MNNFVCGITSRRAPVSYPSPERSVNMGYIVPESPEAPKSEAPKQDAPSNEASAKESPSSNGQENQGREGRGGQGGNKDGKPRRNKRRRRGRRRKPRNEERSGPSEAELMADLPDDPEELLAMSRPLGLLEVLGSGSGFVRRR